LGRAAIREDRPPPGRRLLACLKLATPDRAQVCLAEKMTTVIMWVVVGFVGFVVVAPK
jgi:hypothetical protein